MAILEFYTPEGKVIVDSETITDAELDALNITRADLEEILTPPPAPASPDIIRAQEILGTSPDAITMPEMWELLRIYGRRLGYRF